MHLPVEQKRKKVETRCASTFNFCKIRRKTQEQQQQKKSDMQFQLSYEECHKFIYCK